MKAAQGVGLVRSSEPLIRLGLAVQCTAAAHFFHPDRRFSMLLLSRCGQNQINLTCLCLKLRNPGFELNQATASGKEKGLIMISHYNVTHHLCCVFMTHP